MSLELYREHLNEGGRLHGLTPLPQERVARIKASYPWIPDQYLHFIAEIGVGSSDSRLNIYEPKPLQEITSHPSYRLYRSPSYLRAFPLLGGGRIPKGVVMFADVSAAWRYCFSKVSGPTVLMFDLETGELNREADDFDSFMRHDISLPS